MRRRRMTTRGARTRRNGADSIVNTTTTTVSKYFVIDILLSRCLHTVGLWKTNTSQQPTAGIPKISRSRSSLLLAPPPPLPPPQTDVSLLCFALLCDGFDGCGSSSEGSAGVRLRLSSLHISLMRIKEQETNRRN